MKLTKIEQLRKQVEQLEASLTADNVEQVQRQISVLNYKIICAEERERNAFSAAVKTFHYENPVKI